ncbi:MAG: HNH endonuclease [Desulfobacteraceae bacterium]|nr:HNH endonuclease [Desulfobacteraceae bacterium]
MKKSDRILVYNKYGKRCSYCGKHLLYNEMQVDHLIPRYGGQRSAAIVEVYENWMPSCRRCNHYKRSYTLRDFRQLLHTLDRRVKAYYINKVAIDYGIIREVKAWDGVFFFEKYKQDEEERRLKELADDLGNQEYLNRPLVA